MAVSIKMGVFILEICGGFFFFWFVFFLISPVFRQIPPSVIGLASGIPSSRLLLVDAKTLLV